MSSYSRDTIIAAHKHSIFHKDEILKSAVCGCFYCLNTFPPSKIDNWTDEDNPKSPTALCANCGIDSVIGSASGYPITDIDFLKEMHRHWFSPRGY